MNDWTERFEVESLQLGFSILKSLNFVTSQLEISSKLKVLFILMLLTSRGGKKWETVQYSNFTSLILPTMDTCK